MFLIRAYKINNENYTVQEVSPEVLFCNSGGFVNTGIMCPNKYTIDNYDNLTSYYNNHNLETPYYIVGVMLYSKYSRSKIRNNNYERIRKLRGNNGKLFYRYLELRKMGQCNVNEFLVFYPEYTQHFTNYRTKVHEYTQKLYENYVKCFIKKHNKLKDYPAEYKVQMYKLHGHYVTNLKPMGQYISMKVVIEYFNGLEPAQQMYLVNYSYHKEHKNTKNIKEETNKKEEKNGCINTVDMMEENTPMEI